MSFSFGTPKTDANPTIATPNFGGSGGAGDGKSSGLKFSFGTPASTQQPNQSNVTAVTAASAGFSFGTPTNSNAGGAAFGSPQVSKGFAPLAFNLNTATASGTSALNLTSSASTTNTTPATSTPLGFNLLSSAKPAPVGTVAGFTLPTTNTPTGGTGFSLTNSAPTAVSTLSFGAPTTATSTTSTLGQSTTASSSLSFSFSNTTKPATVTTAPTLFGTAPTTTTTSTSSISTTLPSIASTPGNLNFGQLVDAINKWTVDLEEQGKLFSNQAKQLNAWDRILVSNGEKVLALNSGIERVKQQQQQLDQELDFVLAQQKELEDLITPLEKELNDIPLSDVDRLQTYQMAENMDTQMKHMSEDLKEIIEQLNESNKNQENSNPITQIRKILNAHMDSLQWIDRQSSKITGHLDQISKMHDLHRKSHEHSLKKTYD